MALYERRRADWIAFPSTSTPIRQSDLDAWENTMLELKRGIGKVYANSVQTGSYALLETDTVVLANASAAMTLTLPTAPAAGTTFRLKRTNATAFNVTVTRGGTALIGGSGGVASITLEYDQMIVLMYDGTNWEILD